MAAFQRPFIFSGGSGWIRTSSGLSQQIYSLPRLSNSGARPNLSPHTLVALPHEALAKCGAGSGNRTRISSLEGLHTSLCTMPATNSKLYDYILFTYKIKYLFIHVLTNFAPPMGNLDCSLNKNH